MAPPRKLRLFMNLSTDYADYADSVVVVYVIFVICGHAFFPRMARADGRDLNAGAVHWAGLGL
jgi:hypothetical protein